MVVMESVYQCINGNDNVSKGTIVMSEAAAQCR